MWKRNAEIYYVFVSACVYVSELEYSFIMIECKTISILIIGWGYIFLSS